MNTQISNIRNKYSFTNATNNICKEYLFLACCTPLTYTIKPLQQHDAKDTINIKFQAATQVIMHTQTNVLHIQEFVQNTNDLTGHVITSQLGTNSPAIRIVPVNE